MNQLYLTFITIYNILFIFQLCAMNPKITMIGLAHNDPKTPERLTNAFKKLKPDLVTLEFAGDQVFELLSSPEAKALTEKFREPFLKIFQDLDIAAPNFSEKIFSNSYGLEVPTIKKLCSEQGIPLVFTDRFDIWKKINFEMEKDFENSFIRPTRNKLENLLMGGSTLDFLSSEQVERYFKNRSQIAANSFYRFYANYFRSGKWTPRLKNIQAGAIMSVFTNERETHQIKTILEAIEKHKPERPLHIGGIAHLAEIPWIAKRPLLSLMMRRQKRHPLYQRIREHVKDRFALSHFDRDKADSEKK
jgi:hypothetical protein